MLRLVRMPQRDGDLNCLYVEKRPPGSQKKKRKVLDGEEEEVENGDEGEAGEEEEVGEEEEKVLSKRKLAKEKVKGVHSLKVSSCVQQSFLPT